MRKAVLLLVLVVPLGALGGCAGLAPSTRQSIIDEAAKIAGDQAAKVLERQLRERGFTEEDIARITALARAEAEAIAKAAGSKIPESDSKTSGVIGSIILALLQVAPALLKRGTA